MILAYASDAETALFQNAFFPGRSADVLLQAEPGAILSDIVTNHGSLYEYDRRVPWLLRAPGIEPAEIADAVTTVDIAPTLAQLLRVPHPDDLDGQARLDALDQPTLAYAPAQND